MLKVFAILIISTGLLFALLYFTGAITPHKWELPFRKAPLVEATKGDDSEAGEPGAEQETPAPLYETKEVSDLIAGTSAEIWKDMTENLRARTLELEQLQQQLSQQEAQLTKEKEQLQKDRLELVALQGRLEDQIKTLENIRNELDARMDEEASLLVAQRIKIVEKMDSAQAAEMLSGLEIAQAISVLAGMKDRTAGEIMTEMAKDRVKNATAQLILKDFPYPVHLPIPLKAVD